MGRILTLRGSVETEFNFGSAVEKLTMSYESPDRTKGWEVTGAWLWIDTQSQNNITSNNNPVVIGCLSTDQLQAPVRTAHITTADDNRTFGWTQIHYRGFDTQDYYVPHASVPSSQSFLIDRDRIVTNDLYLYVECKVNGGVVTPAPVKVNYLIVLEEKKITPSQSVLQQLKGIGQNIDN